MSGGVFVTGTDTGVGKTVVACALLHALAARGLRVGAMKPIAAGAVRDAEGWVNEDTLALLEALGAGRAESGRVTPMLLREPMAPHIAAEREGRRIALEAVLDAWRALAADGAFMVVEGVGGWRVPLDERHDTTDLARELGLPVVLVVGLRLGCLNHALLTADAVRATGLRLAGWIANAVDPEMPVREENVATLEARLAAPLLGRLPFMASPDARALSARIDVGPLLGADR